MAFKIKNWKLAILAIAFIAIFAGLGVWQWSRANEKKILLKSFTERTEKTPLTTLNPGDLRFYRAKLSGHFDNAHTFLLDNKTHEGKIGYEVYTPFIAKGLAEPILVDRGFMPMMGSRKNLPQIKTINGQKTIIGMLNLPPTYVTLGKIAEQTVWPLRVEYIDLPVLSKFLSYSLYSYILIIEPSDPAAYDVTWQIVIMPPERHMGYAIQWFAFALTLLIIFLALNRTQK